jgi:hypothetical protein
MFLLFLSLFSLDVIQPGLGFWEIVLGLLMHNIPTFILLILVLVAWKYEIVGGIAFILAGLLYILMLSTSSSFEWYMLSWSIIIAGPAFFISILFFINWKNKA